MKKRKKVQDLIVGDRLRIFDETIKSYKVCTLLEVGNEKIIGTKYCKLKDGKGNIFYKNISFNNELDIFNALPVLTDFTDIYIGIEKVISVGNKLLGYTSINLNDYLKTDIKILKHNTYDFVNEYVFLSILEQILNGTIEVYDGSIFGFIIEYKSGNKKEFEFIFTKNYCKATKREVFEIMKCED